MAQDDLVIDPWGSAQSTDYDRMIEQFGLTPMEGVSLENPSKLHRRGIVFAHRDVDQVLEAQRTGAPFGVLTGLMPSGQMHLGHSMVVEQVKWFQQQGGDVTIAVADLESQATRGVSLANGAPLLCKNTSLIMRHLAWILRKPASTSSPPAPSFKGLVSNLENVRISMNSKPSMGLVEKRTLLMFKHLWSK